MAGTPEGHVESIHEEEATPTNDLDDEAEGGTTSPPRMRVEQLKAQHQELEEARLQLEQDTVGTRAMARNINRRIIEDDEALPHFARASQNIAATAA